MGEDQWDATDATPEASAPTQPLPALGVGDAAGGAAATRAARARAPRLISRQRWVLGSVAALLALALLGGGLAVSARAGAGVGGPFGLAWFARATATTRPTATAWPTSTATATATATSVPSPTPSATPVPGAARPIWTGPIDLGCGGAPLNPPPWVIRSGPATAPLVALTFDDGPSPDQTANILTTLEQYHAPATFFVVGASARDRPGLIRREAADGFTIAIHTWDHPYMTGLAPASRAWELAATAQAIHNDLGANYCLPYWRPPFGDYNSDILAQTQGMGLATVTWSVDPADYNAPGVQTIVDRVLASARPGSIILLHDGYFFRWQTAQALPAIITGLRAKGFILATLPQVLAGQAPATPVPTATSTATATATTLPSPTDTPTATAIPTATPIPPTATP
ncbi:MAG TPA: polysaccharide deacetylase family protein [Ktedonobacterales bacterium]|jgi:peptidoglycan/xylan/chitin deacetylase (PgdA/CDA1 family)